MQHMPFIENIFIYAVLYLPHTVYLPGEASTPRPRKVIYETRSVQNSWFFKIKTA